MISFQFVRRLRLANLWSALQQRTVFWPIAVGAVCGLGIGSAALSSLGVALGSGLCLVGVGTALWAVRNAEPAWRGLDDVTVAEAVMPPSIATLESESSLDERLDMVELNDGVFLMGSPDSDEEAFDFEKPQHEVTVSGFCISRELITRGLYRDLMESYPQQWEGDEHDERLPANEVTWFNAVAFCNALSERAGLQPCYRIDSESIEWDTSANGYRLPTEAEWEYACRAGTTTKWFCGNDSAELGRYAWFEQNRIRRVGEKEPNPWGLYDMAGNVYEWCFDWYGNYPESSVDNPVGPENGSYRALRGGAFNSIARFLRSAVRVSDPPGGRLNYVGFRCVRRPRRQP